VDNRCGPATFARNADDALRIFDQLKDKLNPFEQFALCELLALPISPELSASTAYHPILMASARKTIQARLELLSREELQELSQPA